MLDLDRRNAIDLRPRPINVRVSHIPAPQGRTMSAISRVWYLDDATRCTLCPDRCHASISTDNRTASCLMVAMGFVSIKDAAMFRPGRFVPNGSTPGGSA
jgi:hypothetical protein